jgi:hypothetical protein
MQTRGGEPLRKQSNLAFGFECSRYEVCAGKQHRSCSVVVNLEFQAPIDTGDVIDHWHQGHRPTSAGGVCCPVLPPGPKCP